MQHGVVSPTGRYVAFISNSPLVPEDTNGVYDVFVRDHAANSTVRVSVTSGSPGTQGNGVSDRAQIASGGNFVSRGMSMTLQSPT